MSTFKNKKELRQYYISQRREVKIKYADNPEEKERELKRITRNQQKAESRYNGPTRTTIKELEQKAKETTSQRELRRIEREKEEVRKDRAIRREIAGEPIERTEIIKDLPYYVALQWSSDEDDSLTSQWGIQEDLTNNPVVATINYLGKKEFYKTEYDFQARLRQIFRDIASLKPGPKKGGYPSVSLSVSEFDNFTHMEADIF